MNTTEQATKCDVSRRCRQPVTFIVDGGSWRSVCCEKHLGFLCTRRLSGNPWDGSLVITMLADALVGAEGSR